MGVFLQKRKLLLKKHVKKALKTEKGAQNTKNTLKSQNANRRQKYQKVSRETFYQVQIFKQIPISESLCPQKSKLLTIRSCKAAKSNQKNASE